MSTIFSSKNVIAISAIENVCPKSWICETLLPFRLQKCPSLVHLVIGYVFY